jgi:hypothetical protein
MQLRLLLPPPTCAGPALASDMVLWSVWRLRTQQLHTEQAMQLVAAAVLSPRQHNCMMQLRMHGSCASYQKLSWSTELQRWHCCGPSAADQQHY